LRSIARSFIATVLVIGLLDIPALAGTAKPLGLVVQAREALLDESNLAVGTTVYPGDTVQTDEGGTLRLKLGASQLYLLSSSAASFSQKENVVRAAVGRGTVGFSSNGLNDVELVIPQGILRAANGQAYGQVTITSPQEVVISAYRGALILDNDGELHTIPAGKTYRVSIDLEPAAQPASPNGRSQDPGQDSGAVPTKRRRLKFALILLGGLAVASYLIFDEVSESPSLPK
jgi:hypothetical protein